MRRFVAGRVAGPLGLAAEGGFAEMEPGTGAATKLAGLATIGGEDAVGDGAVHDGAMDGGVVDDGAEAVGESAFSASSGVGKLAA